MRKIPPETIGRYPSPRPRFRGYRGRPDDAPASEAPAEEAEELLCDLLVALSDDALVAAVSVELAERLKRYLDG
jgi:hypothetical protein